MSIPLRDRDAPGPERTPTDASVARDTTAGSAGADALRFLPVGLDLRDRSCLVVGGGVIGTRKALTLAHCGAAVTVVSPEVSAALAEAAAAGIVRHLAVRFEEAHLEGAFLVVAATDDEELNEMVARGAARSGALVCDASSAERSQVTFGAMLQRSGATVAVFTDGRDPARARRTRDRIASFLDTTPGTASRAAEAPACSAQNGREVSSPSTRGAKGDGAALVLIGAALPGALAGKGSVFPASEEDAFARVKRSHRSVWEFLDGVLAHTPVRDALVWNTCQRMELYAWIPGNLDAPSRRRLEGELREALFGEAGGSGLRIGVLRGAEAHHHLLRTACGLESELPGDRDVVAQLETACRSAQTVGTAGPRTMALVDDAVALARDVAEHTAWGDFSAGYCAAALARVFEADGIRPEELRHVVVGGSTTSRSVLTALRFEHHVPERQLAVIYRQHHGQMRKLRSALGSGGRRLRVHGYRDGRALHALASADLVVFGIDQTDPVMDVETLLGLRDLSAWPLTVVDFNSSRSIAGVADHPDARRLRFWSEKDLDRAVAAHVAITTTRPGFSGAVAEAEARIHAHLAEVAGPAGTLTIDGSRPSPAERTG